MIDKVLFGLPQATELEFELADVVENYLDDYSGDPATIRLFTVEEWTTYPPEHWLPDAMSTLEFMVEHAAGETIDEACFDSYSTAAQSGEVKAAMQAVIDLIASKVGYRMAKDHVATHQITFKDGEPCVNGMPLYIKVKDDSTDALPVQK